MRELRVKSPLLERIGKLPGRKERGFWLRAAPPDHKDEERLILSSAIEGGRVNPPGGFAVLYASERKDDSGPYLKTVRKACLDRDPLLVTVLKVALRRILDLADAGTRRALGVSLQDLAGGSDPSVMQAIGAAAYRAGFQGVIYPRLLGKGGRNLAIFLDRIRLKQLEISDAFLLPKA